MALLAGEGPASVTIHGVMRMAELSHGAFYAHFDSRNALLEAAMAAGTMRTLDGLFGKADTTQVAGPRDVIGRYLGRAHLEPETGCPLPTSCGGGLDGGAEMVRRDAVAAYVRALTAIAPADGAADALLALMVGGVAVARAQRSEDGEATLRACRRAAHAIIDAR